MILYIGLCQIRIMFVSPTWFSNSKHTSNLK